MNNFKFYRSAITYCSYFSGTCAVYVTNRLGFLKWWMEILVNAHTAVKSSLLLERHRLHLIKCSCCHAQVTQEDKRSLFILASARTYTVRMGCLCSRSRKEEILNCPNIETVLPGTQQITLICSVLSPTPSLHYPSKAFSLPLTPKVRTLSWRQ